MPQSVTHFDPREDKRNVRSYRRENSFWKEIALIDLDKGISAAEARFYGAGSVVYCVLWVRGYDYQRDPARGCGKAGGYGYHKPSAALEEAMQHAGIQLAEDIGGRGDDAMQDALRALAAHLGIVRPMIHGAHA